MVGEGEGVSVLVDVSVNVMVGVKMIVSIGKLVAVGFVLNASRGYIIATTYPKQ